MSERDRRRSEHHELSWRERTALSEENVWPNPELRATVIAARARTAQLRARTGYGVDLEAAS